MPKAQKSTHPCAPAQSSAATAMRTQVALGTNLTAKTPHLAFLRHPVTKSELEV